MSLTLKIKKYYETKDIVRILGFRDGFSYSSVETSNKFEEMLIGKRDLSKNYNFSLSLEKLTKEETKDLIKSGIPPIKTIGFKPENFEIPKETQTPNFVKEHIKNKDYRILSKKENGKPIIAKIFYK